MTTWILLLIMLLGFPFLLPEVFLTWSRETRRRLRDRVRRRLTPEQWNHVKDEFPES